jgi:hypothetical protein
MAFYGVFIGIDKYSDPRAQELTAAKRDANCSLGTLLRYDPSSGGPSSL